jgi:tetratricopeptide (TPR) repeat protein
MRKITVLFLALAVAVCALAQTGAVPKSPRAVRLTQEGLRLQENRRSYEAMQKWREAVKLDPDLALAWAMLSIVETSPDDAWEAREHARLLIEGKPLVNAEDLLIRWIVSRSETDMMYSIAVANDLVAKHPEQKRILWTVGSWYGFQLHQYARDASLQESAIKADPTFTPAYSELAFAYAHLQLYDRAAKTIKKYLELLPNQPNSEDAYAEVMRFSGRNEEALEHYRQALKILPSFDSAQLGLGDTYALMGDQKSARAEYEKCTNSPTLSTRLTCRKMAIYSYAREKNFEEAKRQLTDFSAQMHKIKRISLEVESLAVLGLIESDPDKAIQYFDQAVAAAKASKTLPPSDREEGIARLLVHKVRVASASGKTDVAQKAQSELDAMGAATKDLKVDAAMHGGRGAVLFYAKKYEEAMPELQDDLGDSFSMLLLSRSFEQLGQSDAAQVVRGLIGKQHSTEIDLCMVQQELKAL